MFALLTFIPWYAYNYDMDEKTFYKEFGSLIKNLRNRSQQKLTQAELSKRVGLSRTSVTNIEAGRQKVALHSLYYFASALGVKPSELLPDTDRLRRLIKINEELSKLDKNLNTDLNNEGKEWISKFLNLNSLNSGGDDDVTKSRKKGEGNL